MPLIAETGGINAMIADATALPEQVADDVVTSAFRSAGQRCSACAHPLRAGGRRRHDACDDRRRRGRASPRRSGRSGDRYRPGHRRATRSRRSKSISRRCGASRRSSLPAARRRRASSSRRISSSSTAPTRSTKEVFGPILHVVRWQADRLDDVIDWIGAHRLRPDLRHPHARRRARRAHRPRAAGRQRLREPQHDRRDRRLAAFRRHGAFRHRPEGRRPELSAALRARAGGLHRHDGGRRQCQPRHDGGRIGPAAARSRRRKNR